MNKYSDYDLGITFQFTQISLIVCTYVYKE